MLFKTYCYAVRERFDFLNMSYFIILYSLPFVILCIANIFQKKQNTKTKAPVMASHETAFECGICNEDYDSDQHKPLVLMCGHTFCRACQVRIASTSDKKCPNCRKQITVGVGQLAINYALIPSEKKPSASASRADSADLCRNHGCCVDYFCVDCGDRGCWKCSRDLHLNHRVESVDDIIGNDSVAYARTELRQQIQRKLDELRGSLGVSNELTRLFQDLKKLERELEDCIDFQKVLKTSVENDLEAWDALISSPKKENRKSFDDIIRRLNEVRPPQTQKLTDVEKKLTQLSKKASELKKLSEKSSSDLNWDMASDNDDLPELLPNNVHWTVANEASIKSAQASVRNHRRPTKLTVVSLPHEPMKRLPERLDVLGSACVGAMEVKPLDSFWRASSGPDERLQSFIQKHGHKVSEFHGSPDDVLLVNSASRQPTPSFGVRLCTMADLDRCSALPVKPYSVCCIQSLPGAAGARMLELGWRPFLWHFPDLHDVDLYWMMTLLEAFVPRAVVKTVWTICASLHGMRLFRCTLPRCRLTEEGFRKLMERYPDYAPIIYCEHIHFSAEARARLDAVAELRKVDLVWEIPLM